MRASTQKSESITARLLNQSNHKYIDANNLLYSSSSSSNYYYCCLSLSLGFLTVQMLWWKWPRLLRNGKGGFSWSSYETHGRTQWSGKGGGVTTLKNGMSWVCLCSSDSRIDSDCLYCVCVCVCVSLSIFSLRACVCGCGRTPKLRKALHHESRADGCFWMQIEDFVKYFRVNTHLGN